MEDNEDKYNVDGYVLNKVSFFSRFWFYEFSSNLIWSLYRDRWNGRG